MHGAASDNSSTATADAAGAMCTSADDADADADADAPEAEGAALEAAGEGGVAKHVPLVVLQRNGSSCRWVGLPLLLSVPRLCSAQWLHAKLAAQVQR